MEGFEQFGLRGAESRLWALRVLRPCRNFLGLMRFLWVFGVLGLGLGSFFGQVLVSCFTDGDLPCEKPHGHPCRTKRGLRRHRTAHLRKNAEQLRIAEGGKPEPNFRYANVRECAAVQHLITSQRNTPANLFQPLNEART